MSEGEAATMKADTVVNNIESNEKVKTAGRRSENCETAIPGHAHHSVGAHCAISVI